MNNPNETNDLKELYKLYLTRITENNIKNQKRHLKQNIESYLDNSIINNYDVLYTLFSYTYDIQNTD